MIYHYCKIRSVQRPLLLLFIKNIHDYVRVDDALVMYASTWGMPQALNCAFRLVSICYYCVCVYVLMVVINLDWSEMLDSILLFIGIGLEKYQWNATHFSFSETGPSCCVWITTTEVLKSMELLVFATAWLN